MGGEAWTGLIRHRVGTGGGHLQTLTATQETPHTRAQTIVILLPDVFHGHNVTWRATDSAQ